MAARALWGSKTYEPDDLETPLIKDSDLEPWSTIITHLAANDGWNSARLGANEPAPAELMRLSPRIWDVIAIPPEEPPSLNIPRKTEVIATCADDLERIATEFIPDLVDDLFDARSSSAVITQWVSVIRYSHLTAVSNDRPDAFFAHVAGAIWEVLILLDDGFYAIPHPLRHDDEEQASNGTKAEQRHAADAS